MPAKFRICGHLPADALAPALQSLSPARFRKGEAVVRRNIEEVDPLIDGPVDGPYSFPGIHPSEDIPQRRSSKSQDGDFKISLSELSASHVFGEPQFVCKTAGCSVAAPIQDLIAVLKM